MWCTGTIRHRCRVFQATVRPSLPLSSTALVPPTDLHPPRAALVFDIPGVGSFRGELSADNSSATGQWEQGGVTYDLVLTRESPDALVGEAAAAARHTRPQKPSATPPYNVREFVVANPVRVACVVCAPSSLLVLARCVLASMHASLLDCADTVCVRVCGCVWLCVCGCVVLHVAVCMAMPGVVATQEAAVALSGTLTVPEGCTTDNPVPAVVLLAGSGPHTRNENVFGHDVLWVIADALTRAGIAVARYDKRGVGTSTGTFRGSTPTDFASDCAAVVRWLHGGASDAVSASSVGILGHSEGALVAAMVANTLGVKQVNHVGLLAGMADRGHRLVRRQGYLVAAAEGMPAELLDAMDPFNVRMFEAAGTIEDEAEARAAILAIREEARYEAWGTHCGAVQLCSCVALWLCGVLRGVLCGCGCGHGCI